ncbi:MAG: magnesium/cobalt transporter CorA [Pseudomonadales bacterium]
MVNQTHTRKPRYHPPGTAPGTYDIARTRAAPPGHIEVIDYDAEHYHKLDGLDALRATQSLACRWIQIDGPPSLDVLESVRQRYDIDPLVLEDIVNQGQRPKFNDYGAAIFITLSVPGAGAITSDGVGVYRQISLYVMDSVLITFMEQESRLFDLLEERLKRSGGRLRRQPVHFLAHALIDLAIDTLFPLIDATAERLEALETAIIARPSEDMLLETHTFRSRLLVLRRIAWASRELVNAFRRHADDVTDGSLRPYLEDAYDHIVSAIDLIEIQRDIATNLIEVYMSVLSNRMNEVIRLLTIIATLFIPPTFLVGLYGMNFDPAAGPFSMPELSLPFGYVSVLLVILVSMVGMIVFFRRRGWLGRRQF